jgi:uncharacterized protein YqfA (UPF0365 family)
MLEFMRQPPEWLLALLWASFLLIVLRLLWALIPALPLYVQTKVTNTPISLAELLGMQMSIGTSGMRQIVRQLIVASTLRLGLSKWDLHVLYASGGNVPRAVATLAMARKAGLDLTWREVCAMQLDGQDVLGAVREAVETKSTDKLERLRSRVKAKTAPA